MFRAQNYKNSSNSPHSRTTRVRKTESFCIISSPNTNQSNFFLPSIPTRCAPLLRPFSVSCPSIERPLSGRRAAVKRPCTVLQATVRGFWNDSPLTAQGAKKASTAFCNGCPMFSLKE